MCTADGEKHSSVFLPVYRLHAAEQQKSACTMFEMFFCVVGYVKLYLLVTLNNDFLPQLKCAAFGAFKTALLRSGAPATVGPLWACLSEHEKAGEEQRGKRFSFSFFFLRIPCLWLTAQKCMCTYFMSLEYIVLLCKVGILFFCDWKHFMSVFMWTIGGGSPWHSLDSPYRWRDSPLFFLPVCILWIQSTVYIVK